MMQMSIRRLNSASRHVGRAGAEVEAAAGVSPVVDKTGYRRRNR